MYLQDVLKEMSGYWKVLPHFKVVWRSAGTMHGAQCVIMAGAHLMLQLCVDN